MLTDDDWAPLRAAVPSFGEPWREFVAQPWYESDPSYAVSHLARHLVSEVAAGRTSELAAFFAALDELYDLATIGLLEDIVYEADRRSVKLASFDRAARGGHARKAWSAVVKFIRGDTRSP